MVNKVSISIEAYNQRCGEQSRPLPDATGFTRFRPHGVLAVLGPFNMPGHLPNGHIIPAVLAGNTIVLKPSELTPRSGEIFAQAFAAAGFPDGVFNLFRAGKRPAANWPGIRTSTASFSRAARRGALLFDELVPINPGKILALEMGGNNPLIVHEIRDPAAAVYLIVQSAYITAGQRCSCARRLIVVRGEQADL